MFMRQVLIDQSFNGLIEILSYKVARLTSYWTETWSLHAGQKRSEAFFRCVLSVERFLTVHFQDAYKWVETW